MEKVKELLKGLRHFDQGVIDKLFEDGSDVNVEDVLNSYESKNEQYFLSVHESKLKGAGGDDARLKEKIKWKKYILDAAGVSMSRSRQDELKDDDKFIEEVKSLLAEKENSFRANVDEGAKKEIADLKIKLQDSQNAYKDVVNSRDEEISKVKNEYETREYNRKRDNYIKDKIQGLKFDDDKKRGIYTNFLMNSVLTNYKVTDEGVILSKDDTPPMHPNGKTVLTGLDEALAYYADENGMVAKSNGGKNSQGVVTLDGNKVIEQSKMSPEQQKMLARMSQGTNTVLAQ